MKEGRANGVWAIWAGRSQDRRGDRLTKTITSTLLNDVIKWPSIIWNLQADRLSWHRYVASGGVCVMGAGRREKNEQWKQLKGENSSTNFSRHSLSPVAMLKVPVWYLSLALAMTYTLRCLKIDTLTTWMNT